MKKIALVLFLVLCLTLAGCSVGNPASSGAETSGEAMSSSLESSVAAGSSAPEESPSPTPSPAPEESSSIPSEPSETESSGTDQPVESSEGAVSSTVAEQTATLYIGTKAQGFTEYPMAYEGDLTPEMLIQGIADLTGWDLTLDEPVVSGKGGISVCLSESSALFMGPPEPQKDEFHMFSAEQLAETLLDSIQKTLQEGFTLEGGDPDALDIRYFLKGEQPLALPNLGLSWALDQPYQWADGSFES